jgi:hypothetical protein
MKRSKPSRSNLKQGENVVYKFEFNFDRFQYAWDGDTGHYGGVVTLNHEELEMKGSDREGSKDHIINEKIASLIGRALTHEEVDQLFGCDVIAGEQNGIVYLDDSNGHVSWQLNPGKPPQVLKIKDLMGRESVFSLKMLMMYGGKIYERLELAHVPPGTQLTGWRVVFSRDDYDYVQDIELLAKLDEAWGK